MRKTKLTYLTCAGFLIFLTTGIVTSLFGQTWVEDTFEDFADGTLDASGNNIYVSHDGKIRTINRFDYNNDGYIDLIFCNTHDQVDNLPATLAEIVPGREVKESPLAYQGSLQALSGDLNKDGHLDLIFSPNHNGIQHSRGFIDIIYGGDDGWPVMRTTGHLPVNAIKKVELADLNQDGWTDIVTLNSRAWSVGQPSGNIIRIYWGGSRGYLNTRFHDIGIQGAVSISSGDFDGNGYDDIAVLRTDSLITIVWNFLFKDEKGTPETADLDFPGGKSGVTIASGDFDNNGTVDLVAGTDSEYIYLIPSGGNKLWGKIREIKLTKASGICVGDVDSDGFNDILLSYFEQRIGPAGEYGGAGETSGKAAYILWGEKDGFSSLNSANLEAMYISYATMGDYDGDGHKDIAIAVNRDLIDFTAGSIIYYGKGDRQFEKGKNTITTHGAMYAYTIPGGPGKNDRLVFCNSKKGAVREVVPSYIYWGNSEGFDAKNRTDIPMSSSYEASAADFNADGYTDMVILSAMHHGQTDDPLAGANVFWGSPNGIDFSEEGRDVLFEYYLASSNVADLNKDGYLDLVLGSFDINKFDTKVIIYYGSAVGFTRDNRKEVPCPGRTLSIQLVDYNKDGWLDIGTASFYQGVRVFYGSSSGFNQQNRLELDVPAAIDLESADLNGDGWVDLVACSYNDIANNNYFDMGTYIFWGSSKGFDHSNSQSLEGFAGLGPVVADFDDDGHLDLFIPHYHGELVRNYIPAFLYWGSKEGFMVSNRTALMNNSGAEGLAADFNKDGKLDIALTNHTLDGDHNTNSVIYYNDGKRFNKPETEEVPTKGAHWSLNSDMGHIYDRSWVQTYESSVFQGNSNAGEGMISFIADVPEGSRLEFEIRSAANSEDLLKKEWKKINDKGQFQVDTQDRYFQYKAVFISGNGDRYPVLDKVTISLNRK